MAKQRGTHQIAGKINNLVYYEQKYIRGGLIRRQNEAMSLRLKEDVVFENTRAANSLYGACLMLSGAVLSFFGKSRDVKVIPSACAHFSTSLLRLYQAENGYTKDAPLDLSEFSGDAIIYAFDRVIQNRLDRFFSPLPRVYGAPKSSGQYDLDIPANLLENLCTISDASRVEINVSPATVFSPCIKDSTTRKFTAPSITRSVYTPTFVWDKGSGDYSNTFSIPLGSSKYCLSQLTITPVFRTGTNYYRFTKYSSTGLLYINII